MLAAAHALLQPVGVGAAQRPRIDRGIKAAARVPKAYRPHRLVESIRVVGSPQLGGFLDAQSPVRDQMIEAAEHTLPLSGDRFGWIAHADSVIETECLCQDEVS